MNGSKTHHKHPKNSTSIISYNVATGLIYLTSSRRTYYTDIIYSQNTIYTPIHNVMMIYLVHGLIGLKSLGDNIGKLQNIEERTNYNGN